MQTLNRQRKSQLLWLTRSPTSPCFPPHPPHLQMDATVLTVSTGYLPLSVSAPSRMPSTPSSTALATSVASARVGRGVLTMVSTTRVMITGLPTRLHACENVCGRGGVGFGE